MLACLFDPLKTNQVLLGCFANGWLGHSCEKSYSKSFGKRAYLWETLRRRWAVVRWNSNFLHVWSVMCSAPSGALRQSHIIWKSSIFEGNQRDLCRRFILKLLNDMITCRRHRTAQFICSHYFDKMSFDERIHVLWTMSLGTSAVLDWIPEWFLCCQTRRKPCPARHNRRYRCI